MEHSIKQEELKKSRLRILQENAEKEERVRVLAEEVERIKSCMSNLNNLEVDKNIVNFDEE
jgi:Ni,Fe-hydrogenase III large subunit